MKKHATHHTRPVAKKTQSRCGKTTWIQLKKDKEESDGEHGGRRSKRREWRNSLARPRRRSLSQRSGHIGKAGSSESDAQIIREVAVIMGSARGAIASLSTTPLYDAQALQRIVDLEGGRTVDVGMRCVSCHFVASVLLHRTFVRVYNKSHKSSCQRIFKHLFV